MQRQWDAVDKTNCTKSGVMSPQNIMQFEECELNNSISKITHEKNILLEFDFNESQKKYSDKNNLIRSPAFLCAFSKRLVCPEKVNGLKTHL